MADGQVDRDGPGMKSYGIGNPHLANRLLPGAEPALMNEVLGQHGLQTFHSGVADHGTDKQILNALRDFQRRQLFVGSFWTHFHGLRRDRRHDLLRFEGKPEKSVWSYDDVIGRITNGRKGLLAE